MMQYILAELLAVIAYLLYKWVIFPRKMMAHYAKMFQNQGYKVRVMPFKPYTAPFFEQVLSSGGTNNDPYYHYKRDFASTDVTICNLLVRTNIILMNPQLIKELNTPEKIMILPKEKGIAEVFFSIIRNGVLAVEGNQWKQRRKLLSQVFTFDLITSQIPIMANIANSTFQQFQSQNLKENSQENRSLTFETDLFKMMVKYTSSVVMSGFLGNDSLKEQLKGQTMTEAIMKLSNDGVQLLQDPLLLIFGERLLNKRWRKVDREFCELKDGINEVLKAYVSKLNSEQESEQKCRSSQKSIIQLLIAERNKTGKDQEAVFITDEELIDEIKTFMIAGSETTSNFLNAMILYVFEKPEVANRLRKEINSVIRGDADLTVQNFKQLSFLECVILETSRVFPSAIGTFDREAIEDTMIGGVPIKKGTICTSLWINYLHNPKTFQNPMEFIPERWQKQENKEYQQLVQMIFSGGPRGCIGKNLALVQMKVMMIKFMQRYSQLVEHKIKERGYVQHLTYQIKDSSVSLTKVHK